MTLRRAGLATALVAAAALLWASWPERAAPPSKPVQVAPPRVAVPAPPLAAAPVAPPPAPPPADVGGFKLAGLFGRAAVIEDGGGRQRVVRVGQPVAPGIRLASVSGRAATLETGGQLFRLDLRGGAPVASGAVPSAAPAPSAPDSAALYRFAFAAERDGGRTVGFRLRDGPVPPVLARAGLRPGDVVTMVNGQAFQSSEKVMELDAEIAGSRTLTIDYLRGGAPARAELTMIR